MSAGFVATVAQIGAAYTDRFDVCVFLLAIISGVCFFRRVAFSCSFLAFLLVECRGKGAGRVRVPEK